MAYSKTFYYPKRDLNFSRMKLQSRFEFFSVLISPILASTLVFTDFHPF